MKLGTAESKEIFERHGWEWKPGWLGSEIKPLKRRRSIDANALYCVIITAIADHVGMTKAEMHNEILSEYHGYELVEFRGSVHKKPRGRSHNLPSETFSELMFIAKKWAGECDVTWDREAV